MTKQVIVLGAGWIIEIVISQKHIAKAQDSEAESRIDYLADILGLSKRDVISVVERMRQAEESASLCRHVITQLSPAWTTDWMSEAARKSCAPTALRRRTRPRRTSASCASCDAPRPTRWPAPGAASTHTVVSSQFGSTACKAL